MVYKSYKQLTIIELDCAIDKIHYEDLVKVVIDSPSNVIYFELNERLYGIVSMGDVQRAKVKYGNDGYVPINTCFTCVLQNEYVKAKEILQNRKKINAIPVINQEGRLKGCYSRWNDFVDTNINLTRTCNLFFKKSDRIVLVQPYDNLKRKYYEKLKTCLELCGFFVIKATYAEIKEYFYQADWILAADEDERRVIDTIFSEYINDENNRIKLITYRNIVTEYDYNLAGYYLRELKCNGIEVLTLNIVENQYWKILKSEIEDKYKAVNKGVSDKLYESMYENFFADLYSEAYANEILNLPFAVENSKGVINLRDYSSCYYNVLNGERTTVGQPEFFKKTIFFYGPCFIYGHYSEDANTIESYLQKYYNEADYDVRVVNYGCPGYNRQPMMELSSIISTPMNRGDIIALYMDGKSFEGITDINLLDTLESHTITADWMVDYPLHCNHRINELYAKKIFEETESKVRENGNNEKVFADKYFVKSLYIDKYFTGFNPFEYQAIGAIVMNCNPFTRGHRYLIEEAVKIVDFLIVFVVEEDESFFTFDERFSMVCDGVEDLKNVMVVPSGPFILSKMTFPEYFIKLQDEDIFQNTENDIKIFAKQIAPYLNLKYRFVGEEPTDAVTRQYNKAMRKVLPQYGIELIEIPRRQVNVGG